MRFALIATSAAAVIAAPFAMVVTGPQMTSEEFLSAVRCVAYQDVSRPHAEVAEAKYQLNAEGQRQSAETVAAAQAEVRAVALQAVNTQTAADSAMLRQARAAACSGAQLASGAPGADAV